MFQIQLSRVTEHEEMSVQALGQCIFTYISYTAIHTHIPLHFSETTFHIENDGKITKLSTIHKI